MFGLKKLLAGCVVLALVAGSALAEGNAPAAPPKAREHKDPAKRPEKMATSGTLLDAGLAKMELSADQKAKINEALKGWKDKQKEAKQELAKKAEELRAKLKEEKDAAKQAELKKQLEELKKPSSVAEYAAAKAAVKDALTEADLAKVDDAVKSAMVELGDKVINGSVEAWAKKEVTLDDAQKAKVKDIVAKMGEEIKKLDAGDSSGLMSAAMKAKWDVHKNVLTAEQQAKVSPETGKTKEGGDVGKHKQNEKPTHDKTDAKAAE